jgi:hypothetical protein
LWQLSANKQNETAGGVMWNEGLIIFARLYSPKDIWAKRGKEQHTF